MSQLPQLEPAFKKQPEVGKNCHPGIRQIWVCPSFVMCNPEGFGKSLNLSEPQFFFFLGEM